MNDTTTLMKTSQDPRHKKRQEKVKYLFARSFQSSKPTPSLIAEIAENLPKIDNLIRTAAPQFPIEKLNQIDLAILRLAVFELSIEKRQPPKVIIDEAVELGKEYGSENSPKFINGVLGSILESSKKDNNNVIARTPIKSEDEAISKNMTV